MISSLGFIRNGVRDRQGLGDHASASAKNQSFEWALDLQLGRITARLHDGRIAMSRHEFRFHDSDKRTVTVTLGYDRPLNYVFCTVEREEEDSPVYSNLDDDNAGLYQKDVFYFRAVLAELGIKVPEQMFLEVQANQSMHIGNRDVDHTGTS
jgi:hypothetical protein